MSKSIIEFTGRRIIYDTTLPIAEVSARLDKELNKAGAGPAVLRLLSTVKTRTELEDGMNTLSQGRDFAYAFLQPLLPDAHAY